MPTNHTTNYALSQWSRTDRVLMEDFNADNAKIDAALKIGADARTALAAEVAKKGNCQISVYTYRGSGEYSKAHPTVIPLPKGTVFLLILSASGAFQGLYPGNKSINFSGYYTYMTWTDTSLSMYSTKTPQDQFNAQTDYIALAICKADEP